MIGKEKPLPPKFPKRVLNSYSLSLNPFVYFVSSIQSPNLRVPKVDTETHGTPSWKTCSTNSKTTYSTVQTHTKKKKKKSTHTLKGYRSNEWRRNLRIRFHFGFLNLGNGWRHRLSLSLLGRSMPHLNQLYTTNLSCYHNHDPNNNLRILTSTLFFF